MEPGYAISLAFHTGRIVLTNDADQAPLSGNMDVDDSAFGIGSKTGLDVHSSQRSSTHSLSPTTMGAFRPPVLHLRSSSPNFFRVFRQ